jgi:hypothetical protein
MNLSGLTIPDIYGVERVTLDGEFESDRLTERLIEEWIPYFECHKCGRWDYCKYAKRHPANANRSIDIKCGVAVDCIRNLVRDAFPTVKKMSQGQTQDFLDGAFHFFRFVYDSEQYIGMNMDAGFHDYWGEFAPYIYSHIAHLRDHLNGISYHWKNLPTFRSKSPVLFVEGYSEKAFIDELRKSHMSWFLRLNVEVYGGNGNRVSKRIRMLLDKLKDQGSIIYAQGDADGQNTDVFQEWVKSRVMDEDKAFVFIHDFETAIPSSLLLSALIDIGILAPISLEEFNGRLGDYKGSIVKKIRKVFQIDLDPYKTELATTVAAILNDADWWQDDQFMNTSELGRFLRFIQGIV